MPILMEGIRPGCRQRAPLGIKGGMQGFNAQKRIRRQVRYEATTNRQFGRLDMIWKTVQETTDSWTRVK